MPRRVGMIAKTESREALEIAKKVNRGVVDHGLTPVLEQQLSRSLRLGNGRPVNRMNVDLMITLGGDGTVLKAVREMPKSKTPIFAINLGRRGYLTEIEPEDFEGSLKRWLDGVFGTCSSGRQAFLAACR